MHSALPVTQGDKSGYYSSSQRNRSWIARISQMLNRVKSAVLYNSRVQWLITFIILVTLVVHYLSSNFFESDINRYGGGVFNDAQTVTVVKQPYIYPDLTKLEEYRKHRTVELKDGRKVASNKNAVIYKPDKTAAAHFSAQNVLGKILGGGNTAELKDANPPLVLVLGLDADRYSREYLANVLADRLAYAKKHGYGLYARYLQDFQPDEETNPEIEAKLDPLEWAKIYMIREAMFSFSKASWLWWLEQDAVIMNPNFDIGSELVFDKEALSKHMIRDTPVIPPESIIHTYKHVPADHIRFITTQNDAGISMNSYLIRNDFLYGRMLFDYLRDPLHRTYPGFRAAGSGRAVEAAVTHLVQWHPAILSRMALVMPSLMAALPEDGKLLKGMAFKKGSFVYLTKSSLLSHRGVQDSDYIADEWNLARSSATEPK